MQARVVAASGLALEARIASGPGVHGVAGGVDADALAMALEEQVANGAQAIISFGLAGGLAPGLAAGTWIVARGVVSSTGYLRCHAGWTRILASRLSGARVGDLAGASAPVSDPQAKRALHDTTSALAVDTESHVAAAIAAAHGLPFSAFRVIADAAERSLPPVATLGVKPGGAIDVAAVLRALAAAPSQLPLLLRTASDARVAFASLRRGRRCLGLRLGCDPGTLDFDVP